jgi:acetyl esterase/lipase
MTHGAFSAPPFDPELAAVLAMIGDDAPPTMTPDMILPTRAAMAAMPSLSDEDLARGGTYTVEERRVPGPDGAPDVTLLICHPTAAAAAVGAIYYTHGAGMVMGDRRTGLDWVLDMAAPSRMAVVSVEYRLAPEHPDPAPIEDCYAGLVWTARHAAELAIDPDRIVVYGRSAGGGLAAGVALLARDRGGPPLFGQMLDAPMLDDRDDTVSSMQIDGIGVWDRTSNQTGWDALLGDRRGGGDVSSYAAPARASDLAGLPPTYIAVGSAEVFRDECVAYASRIWQDGGAAELHVWPGGFHGFDVIAPEAALSRSATRAREAWLRRLMKRVNEEGGFAKSN